MKSFGWLLIGFFLMGCIGCASTDPVAVTRYKNTHHVYYLPTTYKSYNMYRPVEYRGYRPYRGVNKWPAKRYPRYR